MDVVIYIQIHLPIYVVSTYSLNQIIDSLRAAFGMGGAGISGVQSLIITHSMRVCPRVNSQIGRYFLSFFMRL